MKRDYVIGLIKVERHFPNQKIKIKLPGEKIVINLKDTYLVEFKK